MNKKNISKFVIAVALTLAVAIGSGVVGEQAGLAITPSVFAGDCSGTGGGGGC